MRIVQHVSRQRRILQQMRRLAEPVVGAALARVVAGVVAIEPQDAAVLRRALGAPVERVVHGGQPVAAGEQLDGAIRRRVVGVEQPAVERPREGRGVEVPEVIEEGRSLVEGILAVHILVERALDETVVVAVRIRPHLAEEGIDLAGAELAAEEERRLLRDPLVRQQVVALLVSEDGRDREQHQRHGGDRP
jgi:hypothetical protein